MYIDIYFLFNFLVLTLHYITPHYITYIIHTYLHVYNAA